jgi:hypothetical protein
LHNQSCNRGEHEIADGDEILGNEEIRGKHNEVGADKKKIVGGNTSRASCSSPAPIRRATPAGFYRETSILGP